MMKKKIIPLISIILSILLMISCLSLSASASDVVATTTHGGAATPTDLTGYTVTVPSGWSAYGIGLYDLDYTVTGQIANYSSIGIGVSSQGRLADDVYFIPNGDILSNTSSFEISITGGDDVSDTSLIQWLVNNNATFTLTNPDADFPVLAGTYHFNRDSLIASFSGTVTGDFYLDSSVLDEPYPFTQCIITAGDPATVGLGSIWISMGGSDWGHSSGDGFSIPITRSYFEVRTNTYSKVLLDFLMLNTDYEEVNAEPEEPEEPDQSAYPILPGTYTFTLDSLIASVSAEIDLTIFGDAVRFETEYLGGYDNVNLIVIQGGDPASVWINGLYTNTVQSGKWYNVASDEVMDNISGTKLIFDETVYSQALLDFLTLNTDYEEINTPEDPVEYITFPAGVYIFDSVIQVPTSDGVYPIEFRSDGTVFYGMSLNTSSLSYGNSSLDAFAPVYDYSGTGWIITDYRWVMLETEQRVDKRLGNYILAETEYLSLEDYSYIYNQGYDSGYDQGYLEGKNLADSDSFIDGFFGDFFGGVRDALDSLVLYESTNTPIPIVVSVWDVISTLVMLFIVLFVLKLVAGG